MTFWKDWFSIHTTGNAKKKYLTRCDDADSSSSPPLLPPPSLESTKAPPSEPPSPTSKVETETGSLSFPNPGLYEQVPMDIKRFVAIDTQDGFRCDINKQLSPYMAMMHSFCLGTSMLPDGRKKSYTVATQVASENHLFMARVDPERRTVDGRVQWGFGPATAKLQLGVTQEGQQDQLLTELDINGFTWTGNLKYGSMGGGILLGMNYFQSITPTLAVGGEGMYLASNSALLSSYMIKYTSPMPPSSSDIAATIRNASGMAANTTIVGNYNTAQQSLTLQYKKLVTPNRVTLGAELQCSPFSLESEISFGAELQLTRSKVNVAVDGNGRVQTLLEAKLGIAPGSPTLNMSAELDFPKDTTKFGYGITV